MKNTLLKYRKTKLGRWYLRHLKAMRGDIYITPMAGNEFNVLSKAMKRLRARGYNPKYAPIRILQEQRIQGEHVTITLDRFQAMEQFINDVAKETKENYTYNNDLGLILPLFKKDK